MYANITHEMDVRGLPPPEPFENIMRALQTIPTDACLQVHIDREPYPLYEVLRDKGYAWQTTAQTDGSFSIHISRSA